MCGQECVSFCVLAQHKKMKHNENVDAHCKYIWNKWVVSQSFLVSVISNELFPGIVSDAGFFSFTMIVSQNSHLTPLNPLSIRSSVCSSIRQSH